MLVDQTKRMPLATRDIARRRRKRIGHANGQNCEGGQYYAVAAAPDVSTATPRPSVTFLVSRSRYFIPQSQNTAATAITTDTRMNALFHRKTLVPSGSIRGPTIFPSK